MTNMTVLLVDDNEDDLFLTERALKKANVANNIVIARDGIEAIDYLFGTGKHAGRDLRELPVVVLLDLKMPKVDGFEVLRQIRANTATKYLPVVILTASKEDSDKCRGYEGGCNAFVTKPVDFDEFAEAARDLGLFWVLLNQPPPPCRG